MNRFLVDAREKRMARYLEDPEDLQSRVNGEVQVRDDYAGREILELLQNAVDASAKGGKILVELEGDILRVCNDGEPFTEGGINSILIPNLSPKNEFESIGNKGLGFRSLLNDSEYVMVQSGSLSIRLGLADALAYKKLRKLTVRPPVLAVPRVVEPVSERDFVTTVECKLKDEKSVEKIKHQIEQIDKRSVIFLPKIAEIDLRIDGELRMIRKTRRGVHCQVDEFGTISDTTNYYIAEKTIKHVYTDNDDDDGKKIYKDIHITIARDLNDSTGLNQRWNYLYNAFPTRVCMPTGWIVNANFALNAERNAINEKPYNWVALTGVVDLMFEEAEKIVAKQCDYVAIETLIGNYNEFDFSLAGEKLGDYFLGKLQQAKLLPGVNGNYLSLMDRPYFYRQNLAKYLQGEGFENTLMYCNNGDVDDFMMRFNSDAYLGEGAPSYRRMSDGKISQLINDRLDDMAVHEQVELSVLFMEEYGSFAEVKPNFFVDQSGERIGSGGEKFTGSESSVAKNVPKFLNIKFIDKSFMDEIHRQTGTMSKDFESSRYASYYDIKQYRLLNIAQSYKRAVAGNAKLTQGYLCWLYKNEVSLDAIRGNGLAEVEIPTKSGKSVAINLGIFPGGLYEELFPDSSHIIEWFGDDSEEWRKFLQDIGIHEFPHYFGFDFTEEAFKKILRKQPFEQICLLLNSQTWLGSDSKAKDIMNYNAWIEYNGHKYAPSHIMLNEEYGEKFTGYLGVDRDELRHRLNLKTEIFDALDFRKDIDGLFVEDIYKILLQLPQVDRRGKMAKRIYRVLEKDSSFDSRSIECEERDKFLSEGKVFCKNGQYHTPSETFYFAKGLLPKAVTKDKNLIELDKKRSPRRIELIFGVPKLEVDFCVEKFEPHVFQAPFMDILNPIKIGVLATEKLELADESKRDIKSLKIQLCRQVSVVVNGEVRTLDDYEFAMKRNTPSEYCLKIPQARSFAEIRYDLAFVEALAEMFVMRIGTEHAESNSDSIARVIETQNVQKFILSQENGQERYNEAAQLMGTNIVTEEPSEDDFYEQNSTALKTALLKYEEAYLKTLYEDLQGRSMEEQAKFESLRNGFLNFWPDDEEVLFDAEFDAEKYVIDQFAIRLDAQNDTGEALWQQANAEFGEALNYYGDAKSLARFGHLDTVRNKLAERKQRDQELEKRTSEMSEMSEMSEVPVAEIVDIESLSPIRPTQGKSSRVTHRGGFGGGGGNSTYWRQIGYTGQQVVVKTLSEQGFTVQDWSGEAIRHGTNANASDSYGYDLKYVDQDNVMHYIEVKSHIDRMKHWTFEMSKNEYQQAIKLSRQPESKYEVYLVDCLDLNKYPQPRIQPLDFQRDLESHMKPEEPQKYYYDG